MLKVLITLCVALASGSAFGWGAKGHRLVAYVGANLTTDGQVFWGANLEPMRQLSTVPDRVWKSGGTKPTEAPTHWFQADAYYSESEYDQIIFFPNSYAEAVSKYSEDKIIKNGTAPWRIRQLYRLSLQALISGDMKTGLEYAGVMSHYIGDLSQPLHVTENYDGQLSGNKGIHAYFETTIITDEMKIQSDVQKRAEKLLQDINFTDQFKGNLMEAVLSEIERSIMYRDQILKNDTELGRKANGAAVQLELAKDRMADAAASLAMILNRLWKDSGLIAHATPLTIQDPSWVRPVFDELSSDHSHKRLTPMTMSVHNDDDHCSH